MGIQNLFAPTVQKTLPLSKGADIRFSIMDESSGIPTPWPDGTRGIAEVVNADEIIKFESTQVDGKLLFLLNNEMVDHVPASNPANNVSWRLRVAYAEDPDTELPVYEGPIYRGRYG